MNSIRSAMETFRYWQNQSGVSLDHGTKADRERLSVELGRLRADFGAIEEAITREGIAVIPAYWSADRCAAVLRATAGPVLRATAPASSRS